MQFFIHSCKTRCRQTDRSLSFPQFYGSCIGERLCFIYPEQFLALAVWVSNSLPYQSVLFLLFASIGYCTEMHKRVEVIICSPSMKMWMEQQCTYVSIQSTVLHSKKPFSRQCLIFKQKKYIYSLDVTVQPLAGQEQKHTFIHFN